jgi:LDH2 family malate/lactate/ureidoglycolate dehydrogenase
MAPWGGLDKIVGINPLSVAIPAQEKGPLVLDFAFGATAHGKIRIYHQKGVPVPDGWAFDMNGRPTTDAEASLVGLFSRSAAQGCRPWVVVGISTLLSAPPTARVSNMDDGPKVAEMDDCFLAIILDLREVEGFKHRVDKIVAGACPPRADSVDRLLFLVNSNPSSSEPMDRGIPCSGNNQRYRRPS